MVSNWSFAELPRTPVYTTEDVLSESAALAFVVRDDDGTWSFLETDPTLPGGASDGAPRLMVHLRHVVNSFPEVADLADLQPGWLARRTPAGWSREPLSSAA